MLYNKIIEQITNIKSDEGIKYKILKKNKLYYNNILIKVK